MDGALGPQSCIICETEACSDALSDTHTELKIIVTLVLRSHTSPATILLGLTALGVIREIEHRAERIG